MSFFGSFGKKVGAEFSSLGKKARRVVKKGVKSAIDHAGDIAKGAKSVGKVADVVDKVAGAVGSGAATLAAGAAMVGLEPVAAGFAGLSALGKGTQALAKGVSSVAGKVEGAASAADAANKTVKAGLSAREHGTAAIDSMRKGNFMEAFSEGEAAVSDAEKAVDSGKNLKKVIERRRK